MMKEDISLDFFFLASFFDSQKWIKNTFCFFFFHFINLRSEKKKEIRKIMREFVASFLLWSFVVETTRVFHVQNFLHRLLGWTRSLWLPMCVPKKKKTDQQVRATRTIFSCNFFLCRNNSRKWQRIGVCVCGLTKLYCQCMADITETTTDQMWWKKATSNQREEKRIISSMVDRMRQRRDEKEKKN